MDNSREEAYTAETYCVQPLVCWSLKPFAREESGCRSARTQVNPFVLTCTPEPCTTPNNQASEGGSPVNETPIAVDPNNKKHLLSGGNDYNCPNVQGFFASNNGGTTWNHTCMAAVSGGSGEGDPAVGYDLNHTAYAAALDAVGGNSDVILEKSTNNGGTWSSPTIAVTGISPANARRQRMDATDNSRPAASPTDLHPAHGICLLRTTPSLRLRIRQMAEGPLPTSWSTPQRFP